MAIGFVYVLRNTEMPGILKIGQSSKDPELRARELRSTGVVGKFEVAFYALVDDYETIERLTHARLKAERVSYDREFFKVSLDRAVAAIRSSSKSPILFEAEVTLDEVEIARQQKFLQEEINDAVTLPFVEPTLFYRCGKLNIGGCPADFLSFSATLTRSEGVGFVEGEIIHVGTMSSYSTFDGVVCDQGGSWSDALRLASMAGTVKPALALRLRVECLNKMRSGNKRWAQGSAFRIEFSGKQASDAIETLSLKQDDGECIQIDVMADLANKRLRIEAAK